MLCSSLDGMAPRLLTDKEIEQVYNDFEHDDDGRISFQQLEAALKEVYEEVAPNPKRHRGKGETKQRTVDSEKKAAGAGAAAAAAASSPSKQQHDSDLHDFLCRLMPDCEISTSKEDFIKQVRSWNIPSQDQHDDTDEAKEHARKLPLRRRWIAWWSVKGPEVAFLTFVAGLTLAFSLWQGMIFATDSQARAALGGGAVAAKFSAGALYPVFFFMILSMSRWFATLCRESYTVSLFINWDLSQSFHIKMSCAALVLSLAHAISHMTGTFVYASSASRQQDVQRYLGASYVRRSYWDFL